MFWLYRSIAVSATVLLQTASLMAAPPASCARRFIGEWSHSAGTTTISANGRMYPHCSVSCVAVQTWTCDGNTITFSNGEGPPGEFTGTMIDTNHIQGSTWTSTRVGGAPRPVSPSPETDARPPVVPKSEPGLIQGRRFNIVQGPVGRILAAVDLALGQYSYDQLAQFNRELGEVVEQNARRSALKQRIIGSLESIRQLAANQQWGQLQRSLRTYNALKAQYLAMKDE